jgi:hypothetical protein
LGWVVDVSGLPLAARVLVRDNTRTVMKECYPAGARTGPGFHPETRSVVHVEVGCVTVIGMVRLLPAHSPSVGGTALGQAACR